MWWRLALVSIVLVACKEPNPDKFCDNGSCNNPAFPFCDVSGAVSGEAGTCIASTCTPDEFVECRGEVEVRCNPDGTNYNLLSCESGCDPAANGCRLCEPGQTACTNGRVATCDERGVVVSSETCSLGCVQNEPRCREIVPSNGLGQYFDMVVSPPDLDLENARFDTETGAVVDGGSALVVPSFLVNAPSGGVQIRVFVANTVRITQAMATAPGDFGAGPAFALLARGDIVVTGRLLANFMAGSGFDLPGCSGGNGTINAGCNYSSSAGGGGGFASNGGKGGDITNNGNPGGTSGFANGNERLVPLRGGCRGGWVQDGSVIPLRGGGGGGAIQLVSWTRITIDGQIEAAGQEGGGEEYDYPNVVLSGGGSGGAILLEAPSVVLGVNATLDARGGDGADVCGVTGFACSMRGTGARAGAPATAGADTTCFAGARTKSGGGGGGLGRVRINTLDGTYSKASSTVEHALVTTGTIETQ